MSEPKAVVCTALVLAGGVSSRMGQDKALVCVEGVPLLARVCRAVRPVLEAEAMLQIITPWPERYEGLALEGVEFIREDQAGGQAQGPLAGFVQGLAQVKTEWILLVACDLPYLHSPTLSAWLKLLPEVPNPVCALLPQGSKTAWEPLCAFYRRQSLPLLQTYLRQGRRSFQGWLATVSVQALPPAPPQMFFNCNTPEEVHLGVACPSMLS